MTITPLTPPPSAVPRWIDWSRSSTATRLRLFCFPYAGGGPVIFRRWPLGLPAGVAICGIQLPGRARRLREAPYTTLVDLAADAADAIARTDDLPFALFGHSLGGLVAFEVARRLRGSRAPLPLRLFVSGTPAPVLHEPGKLRVSELSDDELIRKLARWNGTPRRVLDNPELMRLVLPSIRADLEAFHSYRYAPGAPLSCPISAFAGLRDDVVPPPTLEAWSAETTAGFDLELLPGDHFFLNRPTFLFALATRLGELLGETNAASGPACPATGAA